jgi:hypothetical protein
MRLPLILAGLTALTLAGAAQARQSDQPYRWHTTPDNESAQFGVPDTDDRALRIDCEPSGQLSIMGPTGFDGAAGDRLPVILQGKAGRRTLTGVVIELGDGLNFFVEVAPTDDVVTTLLAGGPVTVGSAGDEWTVPPRGAARALKPVLKTCEGR